MDPQVRAVIATLAKELVELKSAHNLLVKQVAELTAQKTGQHTQSSQEDMRLAAFYSGGEDDQ